MKSIVLSFLILGLSSGTAQAGTAGPGYISGILTNAEASSVLFNQGGSRTGTPSCGSGFPTRWAVAAGTAMGQAQVAVLLTAYSQGKQIKVVGTGSCVRQPDTETVRIIEVVD